jgi:hypothetical protein
MSAGGLAAFAEEWTMASRRAHRSTSNDKE